MAHILFVRCDLEKPPSTGEREFSLHTQILQGSVRDLELFARLRENGEEVEHRRVGPEFRGVVVLVSQEQVAGTP